VLDAGYCWRSSARAGDQRDGQQSADGRYAPSFGFGNQLNAAGHRDIGRAGECLNLEFQAIQIGKVYAGKLGERNQVIALALKQRKGKRFGHGAAGGDN
jgi:hypothetical protein